MILIVSLSSAHTPQSYPWRNSSPPSLADDIQAAMIVFSLLLGIVRNLSAFSAWRGVFESGVVVAQAQEYIGLAEPRAVCTRGWRRASGVGRRTAGL